MLAAEKGFSASGMGIERLDPAFDALVPADAKVEKLAEGFLWSEGPTWFQGSVVFSDVPDNVIYQWKPGETAATVFMKPSGLLNPAPGFREPGSNGLAVDADGRLLICQQGERRVARLEKNGTQTVTCREVRWQALQLAQRPRNSQERRRILYRPTLWPRQFQRFTAKGAAT